MKSNLALRLITAAVVAPLLIALLYRGPVEGFLVLAALAAGVGALELYRMTHPGDFVGQGLGAVLTASVTVTVGLFGGEGAIAFAVLVVVPLIGMLVPLFRLGDIATAGLRVMAGGAVPLYVGGPIGMLALMRGEFGDRGPGLVLFTLMLAWLGDTGGYFFGRFLGKTKLYEAVSPKKTRAGFVGAMAGALLAAAIAYFWLLPGLPVSGALLLGLLGGPLGQAGDLLESLLKRSMGTKDSGGIVPGHGGLLDRVDAVLVLAPLVYIYTVFVDGR